MAFSREKTVKLTGVVVGGTAHVLLWGGGADDATIEMSPTRLPLDKATKTNILRCVNDDGFGVEAITGAEIYIRPAYNDGSLGEYHWLNDGEVINSPQHTQWFLGWRELQKQGIPTK